MQNPAGPQGVHDGLLAIGFSYNSPLCSRPLGSMVVSIAGSSTVKTAGIPKAMRFSAVKTSGLLCREGPWGPQAPLLCGCCW